METISPIIDRELALERAGGSADLADELFAMLLHELPLRRERVQESFQRDDTDTLLDQVHKLNGSATYCGVPALKEAAERLELRLKRGSGAVQEAEIRAVLAEIDRVLRIG